MAKSNRYVLLANICGIILYIFFASKTWVVPGEAGLNMGSSEPIIWVLLALPILIVFGITDLIWLVVVIVKSRQSNNWQPLWVVILSFFVWVGAFSFDVFRHSN